MIHRACCAVLLLALTALIGGPAGAQIKPTFGDDDIVQAREGLKAGAKANAKASAGRPALQALRDKAIQARHPLAMWVDYWELGARLADAQPDEVDAFFARWRGTYVEDRLRNDWLLELGRRQDWATFTRVYPGFRMRDDREVACYALLTEHQAGRDVKAAALAAWSAQRDPDDGCRLMAQTLAEADQLDPDDIWPKLRLSVAANRPRAARAAAALLDPGTAKAVDETLDQPARWLKRRLSTPGGPPRTQRELALLALMRLAGSDPDAAIAALQAGWARRLTSEQMAQAWASIGRQQALRLDERAHDSYAQAWQRQRESGAPRWGDDTVAWGARAALRSPRMNPERWTLALQAIEALSEAAQREPAWAYWKARALQALARTEAEREQARVQLAVLSTGLGFHAQLANHDLGLALVLPPAPPPLTPAELDAAAQTPGLQRGLRLAQLGLRDEGRREWSYTLRGMGERELLAAAELACRAADWQLCINTSERTHEQIDMRQRYPMPFAAQIQAQASAQGLEPAFVFALIRQEARFMPALRSSAGAAGLMQLMPATARWTARKIGVDFQIGQIDDIDTNLLLGTSYLKRVLDDLDGSQALAAAAYNAGPGRPRRWREGPVLDAAVWAENIPFNETRDYVRRVLANAAIYGQLLGSGARPLRARLGQTVGPRDPAEAPPDANLP